MIRQRACGRRERERGQASIEFALTIGFLVILMVSMLEMTMFIYTYATLTDAAKEGVRYAIVHGSGASGADPTPAGSCGTLMANGVPTTVLTYAALSLHKLSSGNVTVSCPAGNAPGNSVQVNVSYPFKPLFLSSWASVTITANSAGRIMF